MTTPHGLARLTDEEWERVFALAAELTGQSAAQRDERLRAEALSGAEREALSLHLSLGEPPEDPPHDCAGERVGERIELRQHLRDGGAGSVYLGMREAAGRTTPVAVKLLRVPRAESARAALFADWRAEQRFLREFSDSRRLPAFVEAGEHTRPGGERFLYLCTEHKYGLDLRRWCQAHGLDWRKRSALFLQVCDAVSVIHEHGLVHGDLKPDNIQIEARDGLEHAWVLDLGLATIQGRRWPGRGALVGTPSYMCPEQVCEEHGAVSPASDVYALGAILYELLEDRPRLLWPGGEDAAGLWLRIQSCDPVQLTRVQPPALRAELERVLRCALQIRPQDRYVRVSALREALRRVLERSAQGAYAAGAAGLPCPHCGAAAQTRVCCAARAAQLEERCPHCWQPASEPGQHCPHCGAPARVAPEERKHVTALFAEVLGQGSALLADERSRRARTADAGLSAVREAIRAHGGSVHAVVGDALLALFGAPLAREDHAVRACLAALEMSEEVQRAGAPLSIRVGIHSGELLVRAGEERPSVAFAASEQVPLAARALAELAEPGELRLSGQSLRLAEGYVQARRLGELALPGRSEPLEVFQVLRRAPLLDSWRVRAARALTQFVEREPEVAAFLANLASAQAGERRLLEVVGEPGVGKSRLVHELAALAEPLGWKIVRSAADSRDSLNAYATLARILRSWLEVEEHERPAEIAARLDAWLGRLLPEGNRAHRLALQALLGLPVHEAHWQDLEVAQRRARTAAALAALISRAAAHQRLLWIAEDLHWADEPSLSALHSLSGAVRGPLVVLLTYRAERCSEWSFPGSSRLHLHPLSHRGGERMLDSLLGTDPSLRALKLRLRERAGGNPLFLEESVRGLADAGILLGHPGEYHFEGDVERLHVPASIQDVIASRVDALARRLKSTLQLAATVGAQFSLAVLRELQSDPHAQLDDDLEALGRLGFLDLAPGGTDGLCRFQHALIHQVVYESVPVRTCIERHARIVRIIEQLYAERLCEHRSELAEHALRGELWTDAARYLLQACIDAHTHSASREVVRNFERTLQKLERMPQSPAIQRCAIDMRLVTVGALIPLGDHARLAQILGDGERLAEQLQDARRLALIYNQRALALWLRGGYARALELTAKSAQIAQELGHKPLYLATRFLAGQAHHSRGEYRECIAAQLEVARAYSGAAAELRTGWSAYPSVLSRTYLIHAHVQLGLTEAAQPYAEEAMALAERFGHGFSQAYLRVGVGPWLLAVGRTDEALALLHGALKLCNEHDLRTLVPLVCARLALAQLQVADLAGAQRTLLPVLDEATLQATAHCNWIDVYQVTSELRLLQGELQAASELSQLAERLCLQSESLGQLAQVLETRARIERAAGRDGAGCAAHGHELCERLQLAPLQRRLAALQAPCADPAPPPDPQRGDPTPD